MKWINSYINIISFCCLILLACHPNRKCQEIECQNGGSCWEGICQCPKGFTGQFCEEIDSNFKCPSIMSCIENNYIARQACTYSSDQLYNSTISRLISDTNAIAFSNFNNNNFELIAKVEGIKLTIESQLINGQVIIGEGAIDTSIYPYSINITYQQGSTYCLTEFTLN